MDFCEHCLKDVKKTVTFLAKQYCDKCLEELKKKKVKCIRCKKNIKAKNAQKIMDQIYCKDCAYEKGKNVISFEDALEEAESGEDEKFLKELKDSLNKSDNKKKN